ncbi:MAG TPA: CopG family transcriptional regulator [Iamia sp.]|nr:CopG family transcriptional regulator [Iamia sp.]
MRTTVAIDDHLLARAKDRARERGTTLGKVIEDALRTELNGGRRQESGPPIRSFDGGGFRPGLDLSSNRAIQELLDEGMPPEKLR